MWVESRDVADLVEGGKAYPPVPKDDKGKERERNRSCHLCTQGIASWRGL